MFIDTHTHLYLKDFREDREQVFERAMQEGVGHFLLPNIDQKHIQDVYDLEASYPGKCHAMMGLHPCSVGEDWEAELEVIRKELFSRTFIAVGEIGMDLYWDQSFVKEQALAFSKQIEWALDLDLPIVIHARDSFSEIFEVLDQFQDQEKLRGVFHCFTGGVEEMEKIRSYKNFYFGIGGVVTFKNSGLDQVVKQMDLREILLETDAPYLSPVPHRGKRNESSYIPLVADKISDLFEITPEEVGRITSENAMSCFKITDQSTERATE
ncbi:MAG: TatD family deoxyribonuclease [Bacteroidetes bacterium]|nr:MAG: TatD family deoxyribonuclease [Bacteroidota bacterium]